MSVSIGSVVYTLCSDWMIPCKRSPLISPLRMTKSDLLQLLLLSTAADKNYPPAEST